MKYVFKIFWGGEGSEFIGVCLSIEANLLRGKFFDFVERNITSAVTIFDYSAVF